MKKCLIFIIIPGLAFTASAQQESWDPIAHIALKDPGLVSMDNQGFIFTSDLEGNILQFDITGLPVNNYSPVRQGRLSQLEAFWTVNIFTFSADLQEYRILDRFLNPIAENRISNEHIGLAKAATLGNNNIIWILDESDLSLKQYDYKRNQVLQNQPLSLILGSADLNIIDIREYQNLVFLNIKNEGVFIFDNQGNFIRLLKQEVNQKLSFWKENLVFLENENMVMMDYQSGLKKEIPIPNAMKNQKILIHQDYVLLYDQNGIRIYKKEKTGL